MAPQLLTLILAAAVVMGSPGPSTMSVTAVGAAFGFRRALAYLAGIVVGTTAVLFAVAAGVVSMLLSVPRLAPVLVAVSAVYMAYLAFKIATAPPLARQDGEARAVLCRRVPSGDRQPQGLSRDCRGVCRHDAPGRAASPRGAAEISRADGHDRRHPSVLAFGRRGAVAPPSRPDRIADRQPPLRRDPDRDHRHGARAGIRAGY